MRTRVVAGIGAGLTALALAALLPTFQRGEGSASPPPPTREAAQNPAPAPRRPSEPRLYCEFYNFASRTPKVGFYFTATAGGGRDYPQIFQQEADGTQTLFEEQPVWTYESGGEQPTLSSPDGAIRINLYGDREGATRAASAASNGWFEAGLRSIQYLNLEGQCRRTAG